MAFRHGRKTAVLWGDTDLSPYLNQADYNNSVDTPEITVFGTDAKAYITGLEDAKFTLTGYYEGLVSDVKLNAALAAGSDVVISILYEGLTQGNMAVLANGLEHTYQIEAKVADVVAVGVDVQVDGGCDGGKILAANTAVSGATTVNNTSVDNTVSSSNGCSANLHVTANTQTSTTTVKVQHSSDNSTWVDLITFTTTTASTTTSERKTATGTVNRYVRAQAISAGATGALTYSLTFARR